MRRIIESSSALALLSFARWRRAALVFVLVGVAALHAAAQTADHRAPPPDASKVPPGLRLKGDVVEKDLGTMRAPPAAARRGEGGAVVWFAASCSRCLQEKSTAPQESAPKPAERILGLPRDAAAAYIERISGKAPTVISTRRTTLVVAADGGEVLGMTDDEIARLRVFFPQLSATATKLDAHQFAHLYAERLIATESALAELLDLGDDGLRRGKPGPYAAPTADRSEVLLFGLAKTADLFDAFIAGEEPHRALDGTTFKGRPVVGLSVQGFGPEAARRRFAYAAASARLRALAKDDGAAPAWLRFGVAHVLEHAAGSGQRGADDAEADTLPPDPFQPTQKAPADRAAFVRGFVDEGKAPQFDALSATGESALTPKSRLAAWSICRFLSAVDRPRFAALYARLVDAAPTADRPKAFNDAVRIVYGAEAPVLENAWRVHVLGVKKG